MRNSSDWFQELTGFAEADYQTTQSWLRVEGTKLVSAVNGRSFEIGRLEECTLGDLRLRAAPYFDQFRGNLSVSTLQADVGVLHGLPQYAGALFQVASQFNLLEMINPDVCPEDGVTIYRDDPTQGPACAIAAGAGTIYRNYFVPVGDQRGQTQKRQINTLRLLGDALSLELRIPVQELWDWRNGYALCSEAGLELISEYLGRATLGELDRLKSLLQVGLHWDVEVTQPPTRTLVSQAYCSALPIGYSNFQKHPAWEKFATLILEGCYEATLAAGLLNLAQRRSPVVLLTQVGGGAFRNSARWISSAMTRAFDLYRRVNLQVIIVSRSPPTPIMHKLIAKFSLGAA